MEAESEAVSSKGNFEVGWRQPAMLLSVLHELDKKQLFRDQKYL